MEKTATHSAHSAAPSFSAHYSEDDHHLQSKMNSLRTVDTLRVGATGLALLMSLTLLPPLWPEHFNIRPTVSLVIGSVFIIVSCVASLCCSKISSLRNKTTLHTGASFAAPLVGLVASLISVIFFYAANASDTVDTFTSWTCRWRDIPMGQQPHWGTLCQQSYAGLYLAILLIPVTAAGLGLAGWQGRLERYVEGYAGASKKSPALS
ncbi:hypothetical protein B0T21DRAFT_383042 [Apiosordaria backusii]|uniref:Uncharacterized protein n=1 Tax=Apiosordaria backusii TaxID=314023 RepID=A0AA40EFY7_9PEZI|nr:hypothetical protein B0T21DRAFT_383042 [Apiosordaria backusii]